MNAKPWTASGERAITPSSVPSQIIAAANRISSAKPPIASSTLESMLQPTTKPGRRRARRSRRSSRPNSATKCPSRYAEREVGSERMRSTIPSPRSVAIETPGPIIPKRERLHEDAADQVVRVVAAGDVDDAAEDEREQQHEHDRLQRHVEQLLGDLADVLEVAAGQREAVRHEPAGADGERAHQAATFRGLAVRRGRRRRASPRGGACRSAATPAASSARTTSSSDVPGGDRDRHGQPVGVDRRRAVGERRERAPRRRGGPRARRPRRRPARRRCAP